MIVTRPKPLVILTADKDARLAIVELMRKPALRIPPIEFDCVSYSGHESGSTSMHHQFLRTFLKWDHGLVVFDREGCGHDDRPQAVESAVGGRLAVNGWDDRARVVVIDPELESWVWDRDYQVAEY